MRLGRRNAAGPWTVARFVGVVTLAGIVAVLIAGAVTTVASRRAGEHQAIVDLRTKTLRLAQLRIQPAVTNGLRIGNINAVSTVGAAMRRYVLDNSLVRVKISNRDGTIVYSDEDRLIGAHHALGTADLALLASTRVTSKVSDPSEPENRFERSEGKLLEVSLRVIAPNGAPLLVDAYYRYGVVTQAATHTWNRFAPIALGALVALAIALILVAGSLAPRLRRRSPEVVAEPEVHAAEKFDAQIDPPDPATKLVDALNELVARTNGGGVATTLDTDDVHDALPPAVAELVFRATQEALRNVPAHAHDTPVTVRVSDRARVVTLDVIDNGGCEPETAERKPPGNHGGLRALTDLVADAGGRLVVDAGDNGGTRVHVEVPR